MKHLILPAIVFALAVPAHADADTAHHKKVYAEINAKQGGMRRARASAESSGQGAKLDGYFDGGQLRKIVAVTGNGSTEEIYLEGGQPLFVFTSTATKKSKPEETRLYFEDGEIVKWIDSDPSFVAHAEDCEATAEKVKRDTKVFSEALAAAPEKEKSGNVLEGVFSGIEEGDYMHWTMKDKKGQEKSFFVQPDGEGLGPVVENPRKFVGRKCRVRWERRNEEIPEAGGKMEIEIVTGVEWL